MPEQIRLKVGGEEQQIAVYEEFARNIPGFLPLSMPSLPAGVAKPMPVSYYNGLNDFCAPDDFTLKLSC